MVAIIILLLAIGEATSDLTFVTRYFLFSRPPSSSISRWYKFDDNEVIECKMDNDEVGIVSISRSKTWLLMCIN